MDQKSITATNVQCPLHMQETSQLTRKSTGKEVASTALSVKLLLQHPKLYINMKSSTVELILHVTSAISLQHTLHNCHSTNGNIKQKQLLHVVSNTNGTANFGIISWPVVPFATNLFQNIYTQEVCYIRVTTITQVILHYG